MGAVCVLLGEEPSWQWAKRLLGNSGRFMQRVMGFDKDNVSEKVLRRLQRYIDMEDLRPELVRKVSAGCYALCVWVHAMHTYARVARRVEPKRVLMSKAQEKVQNITAARDAKKSALAAAEADLAVLRARQMQFPAPLSQTAIARVQQALSAADVGASELPELVERKMAALVPAVQPLKCRPADGMRVLLDAIGASVTELILCDCAIGWDLPRSFCTHRLRGVLACSRHNMLTRPVVCCRAIGPLARACSHSIGLPSCTNWMCRVTLSGAKVTRHWVLRCGRSATESCPMYA